MPTDHPPVPWQVAECLLPGMTADSARELSSRLRQALAEGEWPGVSFLGWLLMPEDEVLLCLFAGPQTLVRAVSQRVGLPVDRIVGCVGTRWQASSETEEAQT